MALLQASRLAQTAFVASRVTGNWLARCITNSSVSHQAAAQPLAAEEEPEEPRWLRELGAIRTDWT